MKKKSTIVRRVLIGMTVVPFALCVLLILYVQPPTPKGNFPAEMSDAERRAIIAAANMDALQQTWNALRQGQFREAKRWIAHSRKQSVRQIGSQGNGTIHVSFGIESPKSDDGWALWARYIMKKQDGRWVIVNSLF